MVVAKAASARTCPLQMVAIDVKKSGYGQGFGAAVNRGLRSSREARYRVAQRGGLMVSSSCFLTNVTGLKAASTSSLEVVKSDKWSERQVTFTSIQPLPSSASSNEIAIEPITRPAVSQLPVSSLK